MRLKMILSVGLLVSATHVFGQVSPSGFQRATPLKVGFGYSNFSTDWAGRISGPSLWANWSFHQVPSYLNGIGLEIEARDLNYARTANVPLRFDTAAAGPFYVFGGSRTIHPYVEFLFGLGSIDFPPPKHLRYSHDTRTVSEPGGGVEWLIASRVRLRAGYEYQYWPDLFHHHALNPNGFTLGTAYDFGAARQREY